MGRQSRIAFKVMDDFGVMETHDLNLPCPCPDLPLNRSPIAHTIFPSSAVAVGEPPPLSPSTVWPNQMHT